MTILGNLAGLRRLRSLTIKIKIPPEMKQANVHIVLKEALELFREVLKINKRSKLKDLEIRAIEYNTAGLVTTMKTLLQQKLHRKCLKWEHH